MCLALFWKSSYFKKFCFLCVLSLDTEGGKSCSSLPCVLCIWYICAHQIYGTCTCICLGIFCFLFNSLLAFRSFQLLILVHQYLHHHSRWRYATHISCFIWVLLVLFESSAYVCSSEKIFHPLLALFIQLIPLLSSCPINWGFF